MCSSDLAQPLQTFGASAFVYAPYVLCRSLQVWQTLHAAITAPSEPDGVDVVSGEGPDEIAGARFDGAGGETMLGVEVRGAGDSIPPGFDEGDAGFDALEIRDPGGSDHGDIRILGQHG